MISEILKYKRKRSLIFLFSVEMTDRCGAQMSDLSQMLSLGYLLPTAGVEVVVTVIVIIKSAANIYLALMLYMSNLTDYSQNPIQLGMFSYYSISQMNKLKLRVINSFINSR